MSAISRAFTTRRVKQSVDTAAANKAKDMASLRSKAAKGAAGTSVRHQISAPVELIHTTNMLSYNAPDIARADSASRSTKSSDEDSLNSPMTAASSPPTSPEIDLHEDGAKPAMPGLSSNHLSSYFVAPASQAKDFAFTTAPDAPAIPKRAPSHTKKASYDAMARSRSVSTISKESDRTVSTKNSGTFSRVSSASTTHSTASHHSVSANAKPPVPAIPPVAYQQYQHQMPAKADSHPFGRELAQVSEIAEEYGIKHNVLEAEEQALKAQGLHKFTADSYMGEIQELYLTYMTEAPLRPHRPDAAMWI